MKIILIAFLLIISLSCINKENSIINDFNVKYGKSDPAILDNSYMYVYNFAPNKGIKEMDYIKNSIDKKLGMLPTKTIPSHSSPTGDYLYDSFIWESSNLKIELEPHVIYLNGKISGMKIKIWFTKK